MTVRSVEMKDNAPAADLHAAPVRAPRGGAPLAGALMLAFGVPMWILGAKYSLDGWVLGLNILADALTLPARLPLASGWWALLAAPLGLAYSYVEVWVRPKRGRAQHVAAVVILMALTHATDVGSTFLAAVTVPGDAWMLARWAAAELWPAGLWALALTYIPELLIITGVRQFR